MGNRMKTGLVATSLLLLVLLLAVAIGCTSSQPTPTTVPTSTPKRAATATPKPTPTPEPIVAGQALFRDKGCASCHGQNAEGSSIAPALPGRTAQQVIKQTRDPINMMPAFSEAQITNGELDLIAIYITSLASAGGQQ